MAFACPTHLEAQGGDDRFIQVRCLGRLDESILVDAVAAGAQAVWLVDGECQDCPYAVGRTVAEQAVQRANALLQAFGVSEHIFISPTLPAEQRTATRPPTTTEDLSRRAFFSLLARETARTAAVSGSWGSPPASGG